jgi:hypothetical protein
MTLRDPTVLIVVSGPDVTAGTFQQLKWPTIRSATLSLLSHTSFKWFRPANFKEVDYETGFDRECVLEADFDRTLENLSKSWVIVELDIATTDACMATLSDLVTAISATAGMPEATVFAYGRFAREAGFISQKGRGPSAATMTLRDAANLLIAVSGTDVTREAGNAIRQFRSMSGQVFSLEGSFTPIFLEWFQPLGLKEVEYETEFDREWDLELDFGRALEYFIKSTIDGRLVELFRKVTERELSLADRRESELGADHRLSTDFDHFGGFFELGLIKPKPGLGIQFGPDITVEIGFNRTAPSVEVVFYRPSREGALCVALFSPRRIRGQHELKVVATMSQHLLAVVALTICGYSKAEIKRMSRMPKGTQSALR